MQGGLWGRSPLGKTPSGTLYTRSPKNIRLARIPKKFLISILLTDKSILHYKAMYSFSQKYNALSQTYKIV